MSSRFVRARSAFLLVIALLAVAAPSRAQTIGLNYTGATLFEGSSLNGNIGYAPPDSVGAVGPNQVAQLINGVFAVFDKSTGDDLLFKSARDFWIAAGVDPGTGLNGLGSFNQRLLYDPGSGRWIAAGLSGQTTNNLVMLARSETSDPRGAWKATSFIGNAGGDGKFVDYTRLGIDANGVYISTNNFTENTPNGGLDGLSVFSLPKADLLAPVPTTANLSRFDAIDAGTTGMTIQPVTNFGPVGSHAPLLAASLGNTDEFLYRTDILNPAGPGATLSNSTMIHVAEYHNPPDAAQPDGTRSIDTIDNRISANVYQVGNVMYAVHATEVGGNAAIQWFKIDETNNAVLQQGILSDPNFDYFQPSIAANANGDVVISFNRSGFGAGGNLSDLAIVGHTLAGTTTFGAPLILKVSPVDNYHYVRGRWGDYSTTVVDPSDPNVFWSFQQYAFGSNIWATQVTQIIVPEPSSWVLAGSGVVVCGLLAYRKRRKART